MLFAGVLPAQTLFKKVTDAANPIVTFENVQATYKGCSWIDFDGDNLTDLFAPPKFLFKNLGNGQFLRLPDVGAGAVGGQGAQGGSWGDINNDGTPDFILAQKASGVFIADDTLGFANIGSQLDGLTDYPAWDCALADANGDGLLDLLFVHACCTFHVPPALPCRFFLQKPDGTFERVTGYEFTDTTAAYTIPTWADYDLDGDMDLFIGSGPAQGQPKPDFNYKNLLRETGTFALQRLTDQHWMQPQDGQTYNFVDVDNDGDLDAMLTNYTVAPTRFWKNNDGIYQPTATPFTNAVAHLANVWGDMDNDGDLDVMLTTDGNPSMRFYRNNGGAFGLSANAGTASNSLAGAALADYDNDGDLDIFVNGPTTARSLFRNDTVAAGRNWAQFTLEGTESNRSAIGATLWLKATIKGQAVWQIRQVLARNSFQSQSDLRQHFGLNDATAIDSLRVLWPSGWVDNFTGLAPNNFYKIIEGQSITMKLDEPSAAAAARFEVSPNPFAGNVQVRFLPGFEADAEAVELFDSSGRLVAVQVLRGAGTWSVVVPAGLPTGAYFVRVRFRNGLAAVRQIVRS